MSWWQHRLGPRGHPRGIATGTGQILGLMAFTIILTGVIGGAQLMRIQAALSHAAQVATASEAQQGCWTAATTQAVYQTLKSAGVNPATVQLTADTPATTTYGGTVTTGLSTTAGVAVLGVTPFHIPLSAAANGTSFYTPAAAGATNPACVAPATCPSVTTMVPHCTPAHQSCQPVTTQQCTPVTQTVCGPVSSQQCGYTTQEEYTCTPVQHCGPVTTNQCVTDGYCAQWDSATNSCVQWGSFQVCNPTTTTVCTTTNQCGWHPVSVYSCHTVTTTECQPETTQSCHTVTTQQCTTVPQQCTTVPETTSACG